MHRLLESRADIGDRLLEMTRGLLDGMRLEEDVTAGELVLRIIVHIALGLDAEAIAEPVGGRLAGNGLDSVCVQI